MGDSANSGELTLSGRRILVVDDDRLNLRILAKILTTEGYVVSEADSGEAAIASYASATPDLVLLDVVMPGINGFDTCRQLRATHGESCAPVIFITAKTGSDDVVEGLTAGGVDYLPKPFRHREVLARIRTHLQNRLFHERQRQLVEQLSRANAAKNKLLGMAAHDLRNPLSTVRGLAEFLRDSAETDGLTPDQLDLTNMIHELSQSMLVLVNDLLDTSVVEAGELKIQTEPVDLGRLLEKSVSLNNINAARKGTRIELTPSEIETVINLDPHKINQVIDNLLTNAVKFSPPGSVVRVWMEQQHSERTIAVRDCGPGIPESERDRLFTDFGRTSVKPTGGEKSTGLGLAICRKIMEAHRGTIAAENRPDGGCVFKMTLPC